MLAASLVVLVLAGCQAAPAAPTTTTTTPTAVPTSAPTTTPTAWAPASPSASVAAGAIVVTVSVTGGECPNGPCGAEYAIHGDGRVDGPDGAPTSITLAQLAAITSLASATDWDAVRAVPFTGECPTAYDGQKHVYAFPAATGDLVFDSCEFDLSAVPVIQAIDAALFAAG